MSARSTERPSSPKEWASRFPDLSIAFTTPSGISLIAESDRLLRGPVGDWLAGKVQLVFTSPPFPLNRKKAYDNKRGEEYKRWLTDFAPLVRQLLSPDGSIVIELGNAWEPGLPVMSTLAIESLLAFKERGGFHLCQEFVWYNPAKLPTPAQWVTVDRVRVKDAFTRLWWMSATPHPYADNTKVLQPYSKSMKALLKSKRYNAGLRPSEHRIGKTSFLTDNGGAIPPNVIRQEYAEDGFPDNVLSGSNTGSSDSYLHFCRENGIVPHPARMPSVLADFFVKLCTRPKDLVLDPFAGSNTTGAVAEGLGRAWIGIEAQQAYANAGASRFASVEP